MTVVSSSREDEPESKAKAKSSSQSFPGHEAVTLSPTLNFTVGCSVPLCQGASKSGSSLTPFSCTYAD